MIEIDGSYGEGGGQILRTSVTLAAITGQPVTIYNIRGKRSKPGLQPQHVMSVRAAGQLCEAELKGDAVGSAHLTFTPKSQPIPGNYRFDIGTAGATTLVAQTVLLALALQREASTVTITGGTYNPHAPTAEYFSDVFLPTVARAGLKAQLEVHAAGYYPRGGGEVVLNVQPSTLHGLNLEERGELRSVHAFVTSSNLPEHVIERGMQTLRSELAGLPVQYGSEDRPSPGTGAAVILSAELSNGRAGFTGLGERGKRMESVASDPAQELKAWLGQDGAVDEHLADQLVLPLAFAEGPSVWTTDTVTEHLRTVIWLVKHFLNRKLDLHEEPSGFGRVRIS